MPLDPIPADFFGCAGVAQITNPQCVLQTIGYMGHRHHVSLTPGHVAAPVAEADRIRTCGLPAIREPQTMQWERLIQHLLTSPEGVWQLNDAAKTGSGPATPSRRPTGRRTC